jgi:N-acetylneuraminic acid mutarotase
MRSTTVLSACVTAALLACDSQEGPTEPGADGSLAAPPALAAAVNAWTEKGPHPLGPVYQTSAGVAINSAGRSIVYTFGGIDDEGGTGWSVRAYNAATDTWTGVTTEASRVFVYNTNGVGTIGGKLYFSGGYVGKDGGVEEQSRQVWAYDPAARRLIPRADMPRATAEGVTGVIGDILYVLPGTCDANRWPQPGYCPEEAIRRLYRYDPAKNKWGSRKPAPHFHRAGAAGVIGGKLYVVGGFNGFQPVADLDVYDPKTDTWKTLAPIPTPGVAIGTALQGKLYVVAGSDAYVYNPGTNRWSAIAAPTWGHDAVVRVLIAGKPRLVALGGNRGTTQIIPSNTEVYTP